ncbi:MAG: hypothetical protein WAO67_01925 [Yoonia sp.]
MKSYAKLFLLLVSAMSVAAILSSQTLAQGSDPSAGRSIERSIN